jgi:hypothetical protein
MEEEIKYLCTYIIFCGSHKHVLLKLIVALKRTGGVCLTVSYLNSSNFIFLSGGSLAVAE